MEGEREGAVGGQRHTRHNETHTKQSHETRVSVGAQVRQVHTMNGGEGRNAGQTRSERSAGPCFGKHTLPLPTMQVLIWERRDVNIKALLHARQEVYELCNIAAWCGTCE
jgi:hypothetical protein